MIIELWGRIDYMVQLLAACMIFMLPAQKRRHFPYRAALGAAALICISYFVNGFYAGWEAAQTSFAYWGFYILACILFVWNGMEGSFMEAIYCTICACGMQHIAFDLYLITGMTLGENPLISCMIYVIVYLLFYYFFARKILERGRFAMSRRSLVPIATIILLVWLISVLEVSLAATAAVQTAYRVIYRAMDGLCCFYVLWVQINQKERMSLQHELDEINSAWRQQKKQYQMTSDTIESINRKCHDLKHQIRLLRRTTDEKEKEEYLEGLENDLMIYDTAVQTGNKALDTVLMDKGLFCREHDIQWSCMADGTKLDFMRLEDVYGIFGNALDNAIEAVQKLSDPQKRVISVKIVEQQDILVVQVQNYYEGPLSFEDGLPVTIKSNRSEHGYGMKSIRYVAEKYNGTITINCSGGIFRLQILLPFRQSRQDMT